MSNKHKWLFLINDEIYVNAHGKRDLDCNSYFVGTTTEAKAEAERRAEVYEQDTGTDVWRVVYEAKKIWRVVYKEKKIGCEK